MLFLAIIGLAVPTILFGTALAPIDVENQTNIQILSDALAFLLLAVYVAGIIFTFFTHRHLFVQAHGEEDDGEQYHKHWTKKKSFLMLGLTSKQFGFGELFVGAIIVGIVGNAAEHSSAVVLARKGKIDLSIGIAAGSGTQIALFVVPILVIIGIIMGQPFTLVFTLFEIAAVLLAAIILNLIAHDGKSNWFEGVMLTAVYIIIALGFFFIN
jgi:Ca2+:H+ antiporter